jgi:hypothetical protein
MMDWIEYQIQMRFFFFFLIIQVCFAMTQFCKLEIIFSSHAPLLKFVGNTYVMVGPFIVSSTDWIW